MTVEHRVWKNDGVKDNYVKRAMSHDACNINLHRPNVQGHT